MILATVIISASGDYFAVWACAKIESTLGNKSMLVSKYPACAAYANGTNPNELAIVQANLNGGTGANAGVALNMSFGMALWLSVAIHAIGVEIYVSCRHCTRLHIRNLTNSSSSISHLKKRNVCDK